MKTLLGAAMDSVIQEVLKILAQGDIRAAMSYVETTIASQTAQAKTAWEAASQREEAAKRLIEAASYGMRTQPSEPVKIIAQASDDDQPADDQWRQQVLQAAKQVADEGTDGTVRIDAVVERLRQDGVEMKSTRPATSVANILFKSQAWERVAAGLFRMMF